MNDRSETRTFNSIGTSVLFPLPHFSFICGPGASYSRAGARQGKLGK